MKKHLFLYLRQFLTEALIISSVFSIYMLFKSIASLTPNQAPYEPLLFSVGFFGLALVVTMAYKVFFELLPLSIIHSTVHRRSLDFATYKKFRWGVAIAALFIINLIFLSDGSDMAALFILCSIMHLIAIQVSINSHKNKIYSLLKN